MSARPTCSECGQVCGGHFTGCPEMPDDDDSENAEANYPTHDEPDNDEGDSDE